MSGQRAGACGGERAGYRHHRDNHQEAAKPHAERQQQVPERRVGAKAAEGAAVVIGGGRHRVEHFAEAVNTGVEHTRPARVGHHGERGAEQHQRRRHQNRQRGHFHLAHVDFLAEVFRRAANHQARDKHAQQHEQQHPVQPGADAAEDHFANLHQPHRDHAAERGKGVMHGVYRAAGGCRGDDRKQAARENAKAALFAFHIGGAVGTERQEVRVAGGFSPHHQRHADHENHCHCPENGAALARVAHRIAKGEAERCRDQENSQHLHDIGERGRVLKGVRGVGVKEAAAVGAEHLDRLLRRHRPHRQHLPRAFQRGERLVG
ncbi:Trichohyalin [Cronobacter sakazakii 701]|nr:Trichohyalin [Cronobacter sakazakii 701]